MQLKRINVFIYVFFFIIIHSLQNKIQCSQDDSILIKTSDGEIKYQLKEIHPALYILLDALGKISLGFRTHYIVKQPNNIETIDDTIKPTGPFSYSGTIADLQKVINGTKDNATIEELTCLLNFIKMTKCFIKNEEVEKIEKFKLKYQKIKNNFIFCTLHKQIDPISLQNNYTKCVRYINEEKQYSDMKIFNSILCAFDKNNFCDLYRIGPKNITKSMTLCNINNTKNKNYIFGYTEEFKKNCSTEFCGKDQKLFIVNTLTNEICSIDVYYQEEVIDINNQIVLFYIKNRHQPSSCSSSDDKINNNVQIFFLDTKKNIDLEKFCEDYTEGQSSKRALKLILKNKERIKKICNKPTLQSLENILNISIESDLPDIIKNKKKIVKIYL